MVASSPWAQAAPVESEVPPDNAAAPPAEELPVKKVGAMTVPELKVALKAKKLPVSGLKKDLVERLLGALPQ